MATLPEEPVSLAPSDRGWLWPLRITAALSTLPLCYILLQTLVPAFRDPCGDDPEPWLGLAILLTLPYLQILFGVRSRPRKSALALAVVTGPYWFLIGTLGVLALLEAERAWNALVIGVLTLAQAGMAVSAIKTYYAIGREPGDRRKLAGGFGVFAMYWVPVAFYAIALPGLMRSQKGSSEASAAGSLRTITTAEITYMSIYGGYSASLAELGAGPPGTEPTASAADLIDGALASGKKSEYSFTYTPGPRDPTGKIIGYTVEARPTNCARWRSFFTDDSGVIRWTNEPRAATVQDPPL